MDYNVCRCFSIHLCCGQRRDVYISYVLLHTRSNVLFLLMTYKDGEINKWVYICVLIKYNIMHYVSAVLIYSSIIVLRFAHALVIVHFVLS